MQADALGVGASWTTEKYQLNVRRIVNAFLNSTLARELACFGSLIPLAIRLNYLRCFVSQVAITFSPKSCLGTISTNFLCLPFGGRALTILKSWPI